MRCVREKSAVVQRNGSSFAFRNTRLALIGLLPRVAPNGVGLSAGSAFHSSGARLLLWRGGWSADGECLFNEQLRCCAEPGAGAVRSLRAE